MIYEIAIFTLGVIVGAGLILFIGWRATEEDKKRRRGFFLVRIDGAEIFAEENSHAKGVEEIDKAGLSEKDLEKER